MDTLKIHLTPRQLPFADLPADGECLLCKKDKCCKKYKKKGKYCKKCPKKP